MASETIYSPPPGPPPNHSAVVYAPPPGPPPPPHGQPQPLLPANFPHLSPSQTYSLATQGYTTFPLAERPALYEAASSLFRESRSFFAQPQTVKGQFQVLAANAQGSEEGWSRVVGEKELLTLRRGGATCPSTVESHGKALWEECGKLMQEMIRGVEQSLGLPLGALDDIVTPECTMPGEGADRVETLLRMFRYERRSEADDAAAPHDEEASGKGRLVSEPHRDLGLLSLVVGATPGLEVLDTTAGVWIPIEQPPYAGPGLTATLLVGQTLSRLTNGRYPPGRHRVFVPSSPSSLSSANDDDFRYRYSLVFALRPHASAIISTPALTTPVTGVFEHPLIDIRARELFAAIARSHWNVNAAHKARETQRMKLQDGIKSNAPPIPNGTQQDTQPNSQGHSTGSGLPADGEQSTSRTMAQKKSRWSVPIFNISRVSEDESPRRRRWPFFKLVS